MRPFLLVILAVAAVGCHREQHDRPNILFVLIDTLRFDHLSVYGYDRPTSPVIAGLAERGWTFDAHVSHGAQTVPATLSILLSQLPAEHGFVHRFDGQYAKDPPLYPEKFVFLSEVLRDAGYLTAGFVGNPFLSETNGFAQGFDTFVHANRDDRQLTDAAVAWIGSHGKTGGPPFFAYVHLMDVHWPYRPPRKYVRAFPRPAGGRLIYSNGPVTGVSRQNLRFTEATYDAGIRFADTLVGEMLQALEEAAVSDETIVVVTSDHGDEFLEHGGLGHGTTVFGELVRAPLIIFDPRAPGSGERIAHLTQGLDLAPTLLGRVGVEKPKSFKGSSLFDPAERVYSEEGPWRSVYAGGFKLIRNLCTGEDHLFEASDALDRHPLAGRQEILTTLGAQLDSYIVLEEAQSHGGGAEVKRSRRWENEDIQRLRSLGYVE
jgi:arylsulfatase A-like enzyme